MKKEENENIFVLIISLLGSVFELIFMFLPSILIVTLIVGYMILPFINIGAFVVLSIGLLYLFLIIKIILEI